MHRCFFVTAHLYCCIVYLNRNVYVIVRSSWKRFSNTARNNNMLIIKICQCLQNVCFKRRYDRNHRRNGGRAHLQGLPTYVVLSTSSNRFKVYFTCSFTDVRISITFGCLHLSTSPTRTSSRRVYARVKLSGRVPRLTNRVRFLQISSLE
jgi:hypothetical protein